jgi:hypothetical protein
MIVIEIVPDCFGDPIRLACFFGRRFSDTVGIVIGNNEPLPNCPRYVLHVACTKAHIDSVLDIACLHALPDRQGGRVTLAKHRDSFCVDAEGCTFGRLTMQELLIPLVVDELDTHQPVVHPHGYN